MSGYREAFRDSPEMQHAFLENPQELVTRLINSHYDPKAVWQVAFTLLFLVVSGDDPLSKAGTENHTPTSGNEKP